MYSYKRFCSHGNLPFSSPYPLDFNMLVIFSSKNVERGHKLEFIFLYACWIVHMRHHLKYQNGTPKVARKAFDIGELWNPVCCHDSETVKLALWGKFSRILLQRIKKFLMQIG